MSGKMHSYSSFCLFLGPQPQFKYPTMRNHTVRVGSEVTFACVVEQLGHYQASSDLSRLDNSL